MCDVVGVRYMCVAVRLRRKTDDDTEVVPTTTLMDSDSRFRLAKVNECCFSLCSSANARFASCSKEALAATWSAAGIDLPAPLSLLSGLESRHTVNISQWGPRHCTSTRIRIQWPFGRAEYAHSHDALWRMYR